MEIGKRPASCKNTVSGHGYARTRIQGCFLLVIIYCSILFYDYYYYFIVYNIYTTTTALDCMSGSFSFTTTIVVYLCSSIILCLAEGVCSHTLYGELYYMIYIILQPMYIYIWYAVIFSSPISASYYFLRHSRRSWTNIILYYII